MSLLEIDLLADLNLESTPPCSVFIAKRPPFNFCGQPSVARVHVICVCGHGGIQFVCEKHLVYISERVDRLLGMSAPNR